MARMTLQAALPGGNVPVDVNVTQAGDRSWLWWVVGAVAAAIVVVFLYLSITHVADESRVKAAVASAQAEAAAREAAIKTATDTAVARATAEVVSREVAIRKAADEAATAVRNEAALREAAQRVAAAEAAAARVPAPQTAAVDPGPGRSYGSYEGHRGSPAVTTKTPCNPRPGVHGFRGRDESGQWGCVVAPKKA
ncbi:MAG: hypothetical protein AAB899_01035 [Patescibacteria group bacterium]